MLQNITITHPSGIPLYARSLMCHIGVHCIDLAKDSTFEDETLLNSALLNAMLLYNEAEPEKFHEFKLELTKTLTFPTQEVTVIFHVDPKDDVEEYKNRLRLFADLFVEHYGDYIKNFEGDISPFKDFDKIIAEEGLLEEGERFRKNCIECKYDKACPFRITVGAPNRTFKERFAEIKPISFWRKMWLIFVGMLRPRFLL